MYDNLGEFIKENDEDIFITGGVSPKKINEVEKTLNIN